jgi:hypothetical protein
MPTQIYVPFDFRYNGNPKGTTNASVATGIVVEEFRYLDLVFCVWFWILLFIVSINYFKHRCEVE